jgi:hypothetical protein
MEKLTVEIELSKEELEAFNAFIKHWCIDQKAYLKRQVIKAAEKYKRFIENKNAGS